MIGASQLNHFWKHRGVFPFDSLALVTCWKTRTYTLTRTNTHHVLHTHTPKHSHAQGRHAHTRMHSHEQCLLVFPKPCLHLRGSCRVVNILPRLSPPTPVTAVLVLWAMRMQKHSKTHAFGLCGCKNTVKPLLLGYADATSTVKPLFLGYADAKAQ